MLFEDSIIECSELKGALFTSKKVTVSIARLDKIHPVVSGNKLFKLHYFLKESISQGGKPIITFGGAYSNHLVATAFACRLAGIPCTGIVRGEKPTFVSHTLRDCEKYGMKLIYLSRKNYHDKNMEALPGFSTGLYNDCLVVPEGGYHPMGAAGASLIMEKLAVYHATHICMAVGTASTLAGILRANNNAARVIAIPVLKNLYDIDERLKYLGCSHLQTQPVILDGYHFGGYAKKTPELLQCMNDIYTEHNIPTDFVYTGKMMYAILDKIKNDYFEAGSRILCLHTGGLQGNSSLPAGTLVF